MGLATRLVRRVSRRLGTRVLERAGRLVGRWVDTSADAPDSHFTPKRDLYRKLAEEEAAAGSSTD